MPTANENLLNKLVAHEIDVLGYGNSLSKRVIQILNRSDISIFDKLTKVIDAVPSGALNVKKLDKLLKPVIDLNNNAYYEARKALQSDLKDFTNTELDYQKSLIESQAPVQIKTISPEQVYAAAVAQPFQGQIMSEYFSKLGQQKASMIQDAVRMGLIEGQTTGQIVKAIRGSKELDYKDGMLAITRRNAESVVLTAVGHFQNFAQESLYEANDDIIKGYRYTATLDTRTTELCASRDGNFYRIGQPKPVIPAHYRCRSRYVPVLKSFKELGLNIDEFPASTRASMDGQVPAKMTYQSWLKNQSLDRQVSVLGKEKAALFREGKLDLDKFVSPTGHVYTLKELKQLNGNLLNEPTEFIRANNLNDAEKAVETKFYDQIQRNKAGLINKYNSFESTNFGRTIDPDLVKTLSVDYVANRDLVAAVHEPSSYLAKEMFKDALNAKKLANDRSPTLFTAGGSGSGKGATLPVARKVFGIADNGLVYDSVLGSVRSAKQKIDQALDLTDGMVNIVYTNTPINKAIVSNAYRDRAVSIDTLINAHAGASKTIRELVDMYKDNNRVQIQIIDNDLTPSGIELSNINKVHQYSDKDKIKSELQGIVKKLFDDGKITEERYKLLIG